MSSTGDTRGSGTSVFDADDNAWEPVIGKPITRALSTDETVTESTALVACAGLTTPIAPNETRRIVYDLLVSAAAAADIDLAVSGPTGATGDVSVAGGDGVALDAETTVPTTAAGTEEHVRVVATVVAGAAGGDVELQFAQNVSNASDADIHGGSSVHSVPTTH